MIIGEIRRYLRDTSSTVRVSRTLRDVAYKTMYAKEQYMLKNQKEPTIEELSELMGIDAADILFAMDAMQSPVSLYDPVYTDGGDTLYVMDQISDKKNREDKWVDDLCLNDALNRLSQRERRIIEMRFYEGKTQTEVASEIAISQAQVSRLEKSALKSMKDYLK